MTHLHTGSGDGEQKRGKWTSSSAYILLLVARCCAPEVGDGWGSLEISWADLNTDGRAMPTQTLALRWEGPYWYADMLVLARDVPSLGYRVYRAWLETPAGARPASYVSGTAAGDSLVLENDCPRVTVGRRSGLLASVLDKRADREALAAPGNGLTDR